MGKNENFKNIKRIKIIGEFLLAFGNKTIVLKELDDVKHLTMMLREEGIIDIHETTEGKTKTYQPIKRIDIKKFSEIMGDTFLKELLKLVREIDINDPKYSKREVYIITDKNNVSEKISERKGKDIIIDKKKIEDMVNMVTIGDLSNYDFEVAFWLEDDKENILYKRGEKYYVLKMDDIKVLANKIFEESKIFEPNDREGS